MQQIEIFEAVVAPGAHHQEGEQTEQGHPRKGEHQRSNGIAVRGIDHRHTRSAAAGIGRPTKYCGPDGRGLRNRVGLHIETREPCNAAEKEHERDEVTDALDMLFQERCGDRDVVHPPGESEDGRSESECDGVGK